MPKGAEALVTLFEREEDKFERAKKVGRETVDYTIHKDTHCFVLKRKGKDAGYYGTLPEAAKAALKMLDPKDAPYDDIQRLIDAYEAQADRIIEACKVVVK